METVDPEGRRFVLDVLGPGDLVGDLPGSTVEVTVRAVVTSLLLPAGPMSVRNGMARRARRAARIACSLAWDPVAERVADRLRDLAERFGRPVPGGRLVRLPLTQEDLAGLTGTTRESVNRALAELVARGSIARIDGSYVVRTAASPMATRPTAASSGSTRCSTAIGP